MKPLRFLPLLLAFVLLDGNGELRAQVAPWKFVVFGDSLSFNPEADLNTNLLSELAAEVVAQKPDFLLYLGDFSLSGSTSSLELWTNTMSPIFEAAIPIFPVIGNHDISTVAALSNVFSAFYPANGPAGEESSTYAVTHRNALILVLNQFAAGRNYQVNQPWLNAVLATNTLRHVFAAGHMPAFKLYHPDCLASFPEARDAFWHSLSNANARIYFSGHDHFFDHSRVDDGDGIPGNDLHQVIVGTGGAPLYQDGLYDGPNGIWRPIRLAHEQSHGYVTVEVDGDLVTTAFVHRTGPGIYGIASKFSYSATPRPILRHSLHQNTLTLSWSGPGLLQAAPSPASEYTNVPGATSPYTISDTSGLGKFYRLLAPQ